MDFFDMLSEKFDICLNEQQKFAVSHVFGPALVLAGPGSGKTTVIAARTAFLCVEQKVDSGKILTMTFSKAAANDMKSRFNNLYGQLIHYEVPFSTFHSFCYQVLREYEKRQGQKFQSIETGSKKYKLLQGIYQEINHEKANNEELKALISEISLAKNRMIESIEAFDSTATTKNFSKIYLAYENHKKEKLYIDYDDMLSYAYLILRKCPDILNYYRNQYQFIQVDEGQDLSKIQFEILNLLIDQRKQNVFIVADDDQSIYAFRGAEPENILNIKKRYNECQIMRLETNYRSSKNIVNASSRFIQNNLRRYKKNYNTQNPETCDPFIIHNDNEMDEVQFVSRGIARIHAKHPEYSVAIIYRNNMSSVLLLHVLEKQKVQINIRENDLHFLDQWVVLDVISFLKFAEDQSDVTSFLRVCYKFKQFIPKEAIEFTRNNYIHNSFLDDLLTYQNLNQNQVIELKKLKLQLIKLKNMKPLDAILYIEKDFGYGQYIKKHAKISGISYSYLNNIFGILKCISESCSTTQEFLCRLSQIAAMLKSGNNAKSDCRLTLTTMHSSKGLEFDCVFMVDLTNDEIPGFEIINKDNLQSIEEERRLFYVSVTRARKELYLTYPQYRNELLQKPSLFLNEFSKCFGIQEQAKKIKPEQHKLIKMQAQCTLKEGMKIRHKFFGIGTIRSVNLNGGDTFLHVYFRSGTKTIDYNYCLKNGYLSIVG